MNAPFDTLKLAKGLEKAGLVRETAEGIAEAIAVAMADTNFVTKDDLQHTEANLRHEIARVEHGMELLRRDLTIKLGSLMVAGFGVVIGAMRLMLH